MGWLMVPGQMGQLERQYSDPVFMTDNFGHFGLTYTDRMQVDLSCMVDGMTKFGIEKPIELDPFYRGGVDPTRDVLTKNAFNGNVRENYIDNHFRMIEERRERAFKQSSSGIYGDLVNPPIYLETLPARPSYLERFDTLPPEPKIDLSYLEPIRTFRDCRPVFIPESPMMSPSYTDLDYVKPKSRYSTMDDVAVPFVRINPLPEIRLEDPIPFKTSWSTDSFEKTFSQIMNDRNTSFELVDTNSIDLSPKNFKQIGTTELFTPLDPFVGGFDLPSGNQIHFHGTDLDHLSMGHVKTRKNEHLEPSFNGFEASMTDFSSKAMDFPSFQPKPKKTWDY